MTSKQIDQFGWLILTFSKSGHQHIAVCLIDALVQCSTEDEYQEVLDEYEKLPENQI